MTQAKPHNGTAGAAHALNGLLREDLFSAVRTDEDLASLVVQAMRQHTRPFCWLWNRLLGTEPASEKEARRLWESAVVHRRELSNRVGRTVHLRVAALDSQTLAHGGHWQLPVLVAPELLTDMLGAALVDDLTGLLRRDQLMAIITHDLAQRVARPCSVAFVDVDNFKSVNDTLGHADGDRVLAQLGTVIRKHIRAEDAAGRVGGDEFVLFFPGAPLKEAQRVVGRVAAAFVRNAAGLDVSLSCGVVERKDGEDVHALLARADERMYAAKRRSKLKAGKEPPVRAMGLPASWPAASEPPIAVFGSASMERLHALHTILASWGWATLPVHDAAALDAVVQQARPGALLVDVMFPPRGGESVLDRHAAIQRRVLVVAQQWSSVRRRSRAALGTIPFPVPPAQIRRLMGRLFGPPEAELPILLTPSEVWRLSDQIVALAGGATVMDPELRQRHELRVLASRRPATAVHQRRVAQPV